MRRKQHLGHLRRQLGDQISGIVWIHFLQDVRGTLGVELGDQLNLLVLGQLLQSVGQLVIIECGGHLGSSLARHLVQFAGDVGSLHVFHLGQQLVGTLRSIRPQKRDRGPVHDGDVTSPTEPAPASGFPQRHLRKLPVVRAHGLHRHVEYHRRTRMVGAFHRPVEKVVDHQHLGFAAFEATGVDHAGDDHRKPVDAVHACHRHEDPVACKQLDHKPLHSWSTASGAALHDNIADLPDLVPGAVEDWQAPDA